MNNTTYIDKKNKIILRRLGVTLVPEEEIKDITITEKMIDNMQEYVSTNSKSTKEHDLLTINTLNCTYCAVYYNHDAIFGECDGCPMYENFNCCEYPDSTYRDCMNIVHEVDFDITGLVNELSELAKEFIASNQHIKDKDNNV